MLKSFSQLLATLATAALLTACGASSSSSHPSTSTSLPNATTCGIPYTFTVTGKKVRSGSCAGLLPRNAPRVTVHVGDRFTVQIAHEQNNRLDYPVPQPAGRAVTLLKVHKTTATYAARAAGTARLVASHTSFCPHTRSRTATCSVLKVLVTAP